MYSFHVTVHARCASAAPGPPLKVGSLSLATLRVPPEQLAATRFACTFEEARQRLAQLERMYCEPDGSLVWVSAHGGTPWQVDGNLYDRADRLLFVDLKGTCPAADFDRLLAALGWPETPVMFQLVREAVLLDEAEFRRAAERD